MTPCERLAAEILARGPFRREACPFGLIRVTGREAVPFVHGICSQDLIGAAPGQVVRAAFLDPKGRVLATCRAVRDDGEASAGEGGLWLAAEGEQVAAILAILDRYHFGEAVLFENVSETCREWIGGEAGPPAGAERRGGGLVLVERRGGVTLIQAFGAELPAGLPEAREPESGEIEALHLLLGLLRAGIDTEPSTLALEAGLDEACSSTKGCYPGQEIVARIRTYGHVNRSLCLVRIAREDPIAQPVQVLEPDDGIAVGRVLRAFAPWRGANVLGVAYLPADFTEPGTELRLAGSNDAVSVLGPSGMS
ncbi:MAG: hypothetical protein Fur0037_17050 [Planctomycetota bacterium]